MGINQWLALSHTMCVLGISGEMAKSTTQTKLIMSLVRDIPRTVGWENNDVLRKSYPSAKQYLAPPETQKGEISGTHSCGDEIGRAVGE